MLLTEFRDIKPNAEKFLGHQITTVCTGMIQTPDGCRDQFYFLMHAKSIFGTQTVIASIAFSRARISADTTDAERSILEWLWHNSQAVELKEIKQNGSSDSSPDRIDQNMDIAH